MSATASFRIHSNNGTRMIAEIVPLLKLARQFDFFDYAIDPLLENELCIGQLVAITFRNKKTQGIVWHIRKEQTGERPNLKSIDAIIRKKPYISEWQKTFIEWFADYHDVSLARAAYTFIPTQPKRKKMTSVISPMIVPPLHTVEYSDPSHSKSMSLYPTSDWNGYMSFIIAACKNIKEQNKQLLILTPSIHDAAILYSIIAPLFPNDALTVTGELSSSILANAYDLLAEEMSHIIISTRQALGWNIPLLEQVIILDPESKEYKQYDHNPRFSATAITDYMSKTRSVKCSLLSFSPSCEMTYSLQKKSISTHTVPPIHAAPFHIVDLREHFRSGNTGFISDVLRHEISQSLEQSKGIYLFLNRKGYAGLTRCSMCSHVFACDHCKLPMRFSARSQSLRCTTCQRTEKVPTRCVNCASHDIRFVGIGIEKIADTIRSLFPNIPVIEMSNETVFSAEQIKEIEIKISNSIIIGTSHVFQQHWEWFNAIGCIGVVACDPMQSLIDFRSLEYQWQGLMRLRAIANTFNITMVAQSFEPTSTFMQTFARSDWQQFCEWQGQQRKRFFWPPYSRLIKIIARHHTALIPDASEMLMKKMRESLISMKRDLALFRTKNMHSLQRPYFLVRINQEAESIDPLPGELKTFFRDISNDWLIDIDPVTF